MNMLTILGNMTRDPERRTVNTANGSAYVTIFTLAVNAWRGGKKETDYFRCTAWGKAGDNAYRYLHKGDKACVSGPVHGREYARRDGGTGFCMEVSVQEISFCGGGTRANTDSVQEDFDDTLEQVEPEDMPF